MRPLNIVRQARGIGHLAALVSLAAASAPGELVAWVVLALAAIFFLVPIVWLLLETTRTAGRTRSVGHPLGFGSLPPAPCRTGMLFTGLVGQTDLARELGDLLGLGRLDRRRARGPGRLRSRNDRVHLVGDHC